VIKIIVIIKIVIKTSRFTILFKIWFNITVLPLYRLNNVDFTLQVKKKKREFVFLHLTIAYDKFTPIVFI